MLTHQSDRHPQLRCIMYACIYCICAVFPSTGCFWLENKGPITAGRVRDTDLIAESNKRSRLSFQMFSLDMTAPSISSPHVRGGGMSMTQLKSHCRGRIYRTVSRFHSSPYSPPPPSVFSSSSLLRSPSNFSFALTIEMSSLSPVEQGIRAEGDCFNTAVRSPLRLGKMFYFKI